MKTIAFIGSGVMGKPVAEHLLAAGYEVIVHTRTRTRALTLLAQGARWADSPGAAVADADAVLSIVGYPEDVRQIYLGQNGIVEQARPGTLLVDMTTSQPSLAVEIASAAEARGCDALDAPVSGGDVGAQQGTLSIMVGGSAQGFDRARELFEVFGKAIVHQGPAGSGQHTKMCNQITIASNMVGIMESLLYAERSGLDPERVLESIGSGAAASWSLNNLQPRVIRGDFEPGFYVEHFVKDLRIARQEAEAMGLELPGLQMACDLYEELIERGLGRLGTQALYKVLSGEAAQGS